MGTTNSKTKPWTLRAWALALSPRIHLLEHPWWLSGKERLPVQETETRVQSLGWEDPLEEGLATRSSILA